MKEYVVSVNNDIMRRCKILRPYKAIPTSKKRSIRCSFAEYAPSDFSDDRVAFDDSCNFTEAQFKFYYDAFNAFGDWLDRNPIVDIWGIDIDNKFFYITINTVGGYTYDNWDEYLKNVPTTSVDDATNYLIRSAKSMLMEDEPDIYPEDGEDYDY